MARRRLAMLEFPAGRAESVQPALCAYRVLSVRLDVARFQPLIREGWQMMQRAGGFRQKVLIAYLLCKARSRGVFFSLFLRHGAFVNPVQ